MTLKTIDELNIRISGAAANRIIELREERPLVSTRWLRITVTPGGCAGFQYSFSHDQDYTEGPRDDDYVIHNGTAAVVIDAQSANLIEGATIDFSAYNFNQQFTITHPDKPSCGCGKSFS